MKERTSKIKIKLKTPKLRGTWGNVKPYTRIESDKKKYNRKREKDIVNKKADLY